MDEDDHKASMRVVGCFMEYDGKFLILLRHANKSEGNTWGLPAGKVDQDESDIQAVIREVFEETGYQAHEKDFVLLGDFLFEFPDLRLEFPTFLLKLSGAIDVRCQPTEHTDFRWVTAKECYAQDDLIRGFHDLLKRVGYVKKI